VKRIRRNHRPANRLLGNGACRFPLQLPPLVAISRKMLATNVGRSIQRHATGNLHGRAS
jgi:hypothetical protein